MRACPHVCGVVFDPLDEGYVDVCEQCMDGCAEESPNEADEEQESFYMGSCGLIMDYLL